jgi:hypothetical protein
MLKKNVNLADFKNGFLSNETIYQGYFPMLFAIYSDWC